MTKDSILWFLVKWLIVTSALGLFIAYSVGMILLLESSILSSIPLFLIVNFLIITAAIAASVN